MCDAQMSLRGERFATAAGVAQAMRSGVDRLPHCRLLNRPPLLLPAAGWRVWLAIHHRRSSARRAVTWWRRVRADLADLFSNLQDSDSSGTGLHGSGCRRRAGRRDHQSDAGQAVLAKRRSAGGPYHHRARNGRAHGTRRASNRRRGRRRAQRRTQSRPRSDDVRAMGANARCAQFQLARHHADRLDRQDARRADGRERRHPTGTSRSDGRHAGGPRARWTTLSDDPPPARTST